MVKLNEKQYLFTVLRALAHRRDFAEVRAPPRLWAGWSTGRVVLRFSHFPTPRQIDNLNTVKSMFRSAKLQPKIGAQGMVWVLLKANAPLDVRLVDIWRTQFKMAP
jgi:hypothetical protein